jgi:hypothetical protein
LFLGAGDDPVDGWGDLLADLSLTPLISPRSEHHLAQAAIERLDFAHLLKARRQSVPGVRVGRCLFGQCGGLFDDVVEQGVDELFLIGEAAVDGCYADAGMGGNLIECHSRAALAEQLLGGSEDTLGGQNLNHSSDVQAVVDEFGPSDLSKVAADYDKAAQKGNYQPGNSLAEFVFGPGTKLSIEDDPAAAHAADPTTYISSKTPPFIELQGSHDQLASPSQTLLMHTALRAKGIPSVRYVVKGANHGDLTVPGLTASASHPWSTRKVMSIIVDFLAKQLRT